MAQPALTIWCSKMLKVSVIIPAYNAERWISETLASVAAQDMSADAMEVIVIDDGSQDGTSSVVQNGWPQYRLKRTENQGVSQARNLGTSMATGQFVNYLDADDVLLPGKIQRQIAMLEANPGMDIVYGNWQRLQKVAEETFAPGERVTRQIKDVHSDPEIAFFTTMWSPTGSYLYRRPFLEKILPWKDWLPVIQDARFALDCAMAGARWMHDQEIGVLYRQHEEGSVSTRSELRFAQDRLANVRDVERLWRETRTFEGQRRSTIVQAYKDLACAFYDLDRPTFTEIYTHLLSLEPNFRPSGRLRRWLSALIGYPRTEAVASRYRRVKQSLLKR